MPGDPSIVCGLVSAVAYGAADYLAQRAGRTVGVWRTTFYYYLIGLCTLAPWLLGTDALERVRNSSGFTLGAASASGVALLVAVLLFTQGLVRGRIAVVAPITAGYGAVSALLSIMAGEAASVRSVAGIGLIVMGACTLAAPVRDPKDTAASSGWPWALGAAGAYGVGFWLQAAYVVKPLGPLMPVWIVYATGVVVILLARLFYPIALRPPRPLSSLRPTLIAALLSIVGFLALTIGVNAGRATIVVVLSSLTSGVTVLIASVLRATRLSRHQWLAVVVILCGLVLVRA
jgi:drug/metabolite transporter (DMT)-like permease